MTGDAGTPWLVTHGDAVHGVALYADVLAAAVAAQAGRDTRVTIDGAATAGRAHAQFTDRLWAASPEAAAMRMTELARRVALTVTLHDVPQPSDGARNLARRADCYRRVARAARGVVCSSEHERALLGRHVDAGVAARAIVIPLPIDSFPAPATRPAPDAAAGVLGFFYPGKGHAEVADALARRAARTGRRQRMTVLGRGSDGHEADLAAFADAAGTTGVDVDVTGYLAENDLVARARRIAVPIAAHRHVSASGSMGFWVAAGRRPVVTANDYTREMAALRPGTLTVVAEAALADALDAAFDDPASAWVPAGAVTRPHSADAAAAHLAWWRDEVAW